MPTGGLYRHAAARQSVNGGKREALGFSIVPPQTREDADIGIDRLAEGDACAIFERANAVRQRHIRCGSGCPRQLQSLRIIAPLVAIIVAEHANRSLPLSPRVAPFHLPYLPVIAE